MEKNYKKFEKWYQQFVSQKPKFKKRIESLSDLGRSEEHKRGHALLEEAERLVQEIRGYAQQAKEGKNVSSVLKKKIKKFRSLYRELNEFRKTEWRQWMEAIGIAILVVFVLRNYFFGLYHVPSGSAEPTLLVGDRVLGNKMAYFFGEKPKRGDLVMFENPNFDYDQSSKTNRFWQKYAGFGVPILGLPSGPENFVKRVIAMPGDTIEGRVEGGKTVTYLNGKKSDEPYVNPHPLIALEKKTGFIDLDTIGPLPIPEFIKRKSKYPVFYTYVETEDFSGQPYYNMSSEEVGLEPGTLRPWMRLPFTPTANEYGKNVDIFGPITVPDGKYWVMGDSRKNSKDSRFWGLLDDRLIHGRASFVIYSIDSEEPFWLFELIKNPVKFWTKSLRWNRFFKKLWLSEKVSPEKSKG